MRQISKVIGNEETNSINYSINQNLIFWCKFPGKNLADKCLGFQLYIEENDEDPSYSQSYISITEP